MDKEPKKGQINIPLNKIATIVFTIVGIFLLIMYFYEGQQTHIDEVSKTGKYTDAFKVGFMTSCQKDGTKEQCECAVDFYEKNYTYSEYLEVRDEDIVIAKMREKCL